MVCHVIVKNSRHSKSLKFVVKNVKRKAQNICSTLFHNTTMTVFSQIIWVICDIFGLKVLSLTLAPHFE